MSQSEWNHYLASIVASIATSKLSHIPHVGRAIAKFIGKSASK
jgi:hypothetical protein